MGPSPGLHFFPICSIMGPFHRVTTSFGHPPAPVWGSSWAAGGSQLYHGVPCRRVSAPPWSSMGCRRVSALPWSSMQGDLSSIMELHGLQGDLSSIMELHHGAPWAAGPQLPHHGLHHSLQGHLCSGACSTSSPSFPTESAGLLLSCSPSSLLCLQLLLHNKFSPFLNTLF